MASLPATKTAAESMSQLDDHSDIYTALHKLRCTFGGRSIVPDIAVVAWDRIPLDENEVKR